MLKPRAGFRDASIEPVDSRVLEVRYAIADAGANLYAGQLLDVYIARTGRAVRVAATPAAKADAALRP
jgi:hypothetical protein